MQLLFSFPENYLPTHQRLKWYLRIIRFVITGPLLLLMAVSIFNNWYGTEPNTICQRRDECLANCEADVFPELSCGDKVYLEIEYNGNTYDEFYLYKANGSDEFDDCYNYVGDNEDFQDSVSENRQWRVHTCFRSCIDLQFEGSNYEDNYEKDEREICSADENDILCVLPGDDCEVFEAADEFCIGDNICISMIVIWLSIFVANAGQLIIEASMLYTLDITFTPTELEKKMNNMRDEASLGREDAAEPPCDKVVKKCAGEMIMFFTFFVSVIAVSFAMDATYKYGRPGTVWFEWFLAFVIDQAKCFVIQPFLWWLIVRRCGSLYPGFEYWTDEQVLPGVNDLSFLDDVRASTNRMLGHKHVNFFITATIVFYSVFILLNLSIDPYIENDQDALDFFYYTDLVFLVFFVFEIMVRFFAQAFKYLCEPWSFIDAVIVTVSFVFSIIRLEIKGIGVLRLLRLIRVVIVMRRVSEQKKNLLRIQSNNTVSQNVPRVLELLENLQKDKLVPRNLKQDLAWVTDLIQNKKIYTSGMLNNDDEEVTEAVKSWRKQVRGEDDEIMNMPVMAKDPNRERVLRRARQSSADMKLFSTDYYDEMIKGLFLNTIEGREALEKDKYQELEESLEKVDEWTFDLFKFFNIAGEYAFPFFGLKIFLRHEIFKLCDEFNPDIFYNFLTNLQEGYAFKNPYHKEEHIIDTVQAMHYFFRTAGFEAKLSIHDIMVGFIAAWIHDYEHPGLTNQFLIRTKHPKAVRYSDISPLENHHVAAAYKLMLSSPDLNIFEYMDPLQYEVTRKMLISMVIQTDLSYHFDLSTSTQARLLGETFPADTFEEHLLFLTFTLHCADISKPARPLSTYLKWMEWMTEEFFLQGDMEGELGIPKSSFMDRENTNRDRVQFTYIEYIVKDSIVLLNILSPEDYVGVIEKDLVQNGLNLNRKTLQKRLEGDPKI